MKILFSLIITFFICSTSTYAESFSVLGENFNVRLSNDLCFLHDNDPVENAVLQSIQVAPQGLEIHVGFVDCNSLNKIKNGTDVNVLSTLGAIKNNNKKYIYSNQLFLEEMERKFNVNSSSLDSLIKNNINKSANDKNISGDFSASGTNFLGKDENTIYLSGNVVVNGSVFSFISAFTLLKGVVFNIEVLSSKYSISGLFEIVKEIKNHLN